MSKRIAMRRRLVIIATIDTATLDEAEAVLTQGSVPLENAGATIVQATTEEEDQ